MKNIAKNLLWIILAFFIISAIFSLLSQSFKKTEIISLSQLVGFINDGQIQKITISGNDLNIELTNGELRKAKKEAEASLTRAERRR